jgi:integrase
MRAASSQFTPTGVSTLDWLGENPALRPSERRVPTVAQYTATWLESIEGLVSARTLEDYAGRLERHVLPRLGQRRLDEVGVDHVLALIADLRKRGYAGSTIGAVLNPLSRLFAHAIRRELIQVSPVSKLERSERPRVSRRERPVLSRDEITRLLEATPPHYRTLLATAILSGLRQGELLGLHWRDVDFDNEVIRVRSALDRKQVDVRPKTPHALRDVVLMPTLAEALQQHRAESHFCEPSNYIFTTRVGTPLHWANLASRVLNPALRRAGLRHLRWHDLRHTFAVC